MLKSFVLCVLLLAMAAPAHALPPHPLAIHDKWVVPDGGVCASIYNGGPLTLPYGVANGTIVLDHLHTLHFIDPAIQAMLWHGYVRRFDLDAAATHDGYSSALLAFEKPGVPVDQQEAIIMVITKPFWLEDTGWIPVTQVIGGLVCDSAGVVFTKTSVVDSALALIGTTSSNSLSSGGGSQVSSDDLEFRYTSYEHGPWTGFGANLSPGQQCMWKQWGQRMASSGAGGAIGGTVGAMASGEFGWQSLAARATVGAAIAMWTANENFWISPPDTANCH
jgi:hypothetical protein